MVAYGYVKLGKPKPDEKSDSFVGKIYTVTSCISGASSAKKALEQAKELLLQLNEIAKVNKDIDEWMSIAAELKEKFPSLFENSLERITTRRESRGRD